MPNALMSQTAEALRFMDQTIPTVLRKNNLGFTLKSLGQRFGGKQTNVNSFFITIEIPEANDRDVSANHLIDDLKKTLSGNEQYTDLMFRKARWGQQSGSAIEIKVQSNNDQDRARALAILEDALKSLIEVDSVEIKKAFIQPVIEIDLNQERQRLGVDTTTIAASLKSAMGGVQFDIQRQLDQLITNFDSKIIKRAPLTIFSI